MFIIKVDIRERDLIPLIRDKLGENDKIVLKTESLPLGDIIFMKDEEEIIIIERGKNYF